MKKFVHLIVMSTLLPILCACVHEYPRIDEPHDVMLHFHHDIGWSYSDMTISRTGVEAPAPIIKGVNARYHLLFYRAGEYSYPILDMELHRDDLSRQDFDECVSLPPGDYELYLWSDYADAGQKTSIFFNSSDHSSIVYSEPYNGNNELRDAFRAYAGFTVQSTIDYDYCENVAVTIERPLARYEIVATDFGEFVQREIARAESTNESAGNTTEQCSLEAPPSRAINIEDYKVVVKYTEYMPSTFNNFSNGPVDSSVGVTYEAVVTPLSDDEARIGFDYVMVNGDESSVKIAVDIYTKDGQKIASSNAFDVPTKRSHNTTVRGRFLTSQGSGGVTIDPTFSGTYIINV